MPLDYSTDFLLITYRPDLDQLACRWRRAVTAAELHQGYAALRQAAQHHGCRYWLIDARRRPTGSLSSPEWVTAQLLPQVQQALGGVLCVGFLVLPDYLAALPPVLRAPAPGSPVQFARFLDEGAVNTWLAEQQAARQAPPRGLFGAGC